MVDIQSELNELKRKVDFNTYDISVKELISMVKEGIIDIAPEYQRQFRWKEGRQSALIESIFLGIPVPSLFAATNSDGSWELIDGVQRLSSIMHFAGDEEALKKIGSTSRLKLQELKKLIQFENKSFETLPRSIQLEFLLKPLKVTTLTDKSDSKVRFDLFERLNTGGVSLTNQEIRSCVFRGKFNDFLKEISTDTNFHTVVKLTSSQETDGTRVEYVLKFFAYLNNYKNFDHSVIDFLNNFMLDAGKKFDYTSNEKLFRKTFEELLALPRGITRNRTTTPSNLFEAVSVGAAIVLLNEPRLNTANLDWVAGDELKELTTGATNSRTKVAQRIEFCRKKFSLNAA